jgi:aconitate hydratase
MPASTTDPFNARTELDAALGRRAVYRLDALKAAGLGDVSRLPYCIKVLLESCLRNLDGRIVTEDDVRAIAAYDARNVPDIEIPFRPGRVVLQDFTGVPAIVDLAAMRDAIVEMTGDESSAKQVNPLVKCDLVIDHSVQVDEFATATALTVNSQKEFQRNAERYQFLKWGQSAFDNFSVVPPATGIVHQVNLEYLARVVWDGDEMTGQEAALYPDSLVGTDSHTTMINGLGVVGWGVGGIEAEAVMLGQPIYMLIPEVVGFRLTGRLAEGATATDLVLRVTEMLRAHGVVGKFVEYFGDGLKDMPVANRATIANMSPEYGATMGFFPVDDQTLTYMRLTGRDEKLIDTVEQYYKLQGMWHDPERRIEYTDVLELDMSTVEPSLAGPRRPQDRIALGGMKNQWAQDLSVTFGKSSACASSTVESFTDEGGAQTAVAVAEPKTADDPGLEGVDVEFGGTRFKLKHGDVCIAAITSCTNTSNPDVMLGAGIVARKAHERGLTRRPWVKTSLAPGSKVVTEYLNKAGLMDDLEALGFYLVGYGCTTCIGNSGPLPEPISKAINEHDLVVASVLSGNRNFEGRIGPDVRANYLASPPLVVAYAIAGTVDIDLANDPLAEDKNGDPVFLKDIWPTQDEIAKLRRECVGKDQFIEQYANVFEGSEEWRAVEVTGGALYDWSDKSTYIQSPPFFEGLTPEVRSIQPIEDARVLCMLGDSVTTDHISPAGSIATDSPAGKYLIEKGVPISMFNSFGSRRGNDRVMTRGTFGNIRVRNHLAPGTEGGWTVDFSVPPSPSARGAGGEGASEAASEGREGPSKNGGTGIGGYPITTVYDAAMAYKKKNIPLVVLAGKDYGMGSSRDWAAKGTFLLGVKAVIAESFERIHRSNLIGMGVLPLVYKNGENAESLGLDGTETFTIHVDDGLKPKQDVKVTARRLPSSSGRGAGSEGAPNGTTIEFTTTCRADIPVEVEYYRNGGILHTVLRKMAKGA